MSDENTAETLNKSETVETLKQPTDGKKQQRSSIAFPYMDLNEAVALATSVYENVGTGICSADQLAAWIKQSATSSAFRLRLSAGRLFGVLETEGGEEIHLTELGRWVVDSKREKEGRAKAFLSVPLFRAVFDKFKGGGIPPTAALEKELVSLGVADTLKDRARSVLERSAEQSGYFDHGRDRLVMPGFAPAEDRPPAPRDEAKGDGGAGGGGGGNGGGAQDSLNLDKLLMALLLKIPERPDEWPAATRVRWFRTFAMNVSQVYDDDNAVIDLDIKLIAPAGSNSVESK